MKRIITFKKFENDFRDFYKCKDIVIRNEIEAEIVFWDLYTCDLYEFNYENKTIELYY